MRNPFASEPAAFRFLFVTLAALAAVTAAALLAGAWPAVLVTAVVCAVVLVSYARRRRRRLLRTAPAHLGPLQERRLLVLAQGPLPEEAFGDIMGRADRVLVVSAAAPPALRRWASDLDRARAEAQVRVDATVSRLRELHADADGTVGDDDPVQAIEDALRTWGGDEILVSTAPDARDQAVVARLRERFALPVTHVA